MLCLTLPNEAVCSLNACCSCDTKNVTIFLVFRSVILTSLLFLWLPFGVVKDTTADIWHILLKWNQYVREYERSSLHQAVTGAKSPFADVSAQTSELNCHSMADGHLSNLPTSAGKFTV